MFDPKELNRAFAREKETEGIVKGLVLSLDMTKTEVVKEITYQERKLQEIQERIELLKSHAYEPG